MQRITTFLTFKSGGKDAIDLYVSLFEDSAVHHMMVMPGTDQLLHASFSLAGQEFMAMDGGQEFDFGIGTSLYVDCADQAEVDRYWEALTSTGGEPGQCGWLKDRFGVSWQIIPRILGELMSGPDQARSMKVRDAMLAMGKLDVEGLRRAYDEAG